MRKHSKNNTTQWSHASISVVCHLIPVKTHASAKNVFNSFTERQRSSHGAILLHCCYCGILEHLSSGCACMCVDLRVWKQLSGVFYFLHRKRSRESAVDEGYKWKEDWIWIMSAFIYNKHGLKIKYVFLITSLLSQTLFQSASFLLRTPNARKSLTMIGRRG